MDELNNAQQETTEAAIAELIGPDGTRHQLTEEQYRACCDMLWPEEPVLAEFEGQRLTTGQAAELLGVSRRTLTRMLDRGEIPCERMGKNHHRTVMLPDVLEFKAKASGYASEVYAALARSERDIAAGRVAPVEEVHASLRAEFAERAALAQAS